MIGLYITGSPGLKDHLMVKTPSFQILHSGVGTQTCVFKLESSSWEGSLSALRY